MLILTFCTLPYFEINLNTLNKLNTSNYIYLYLILIQAYKKVFVFNSLLNATDIKL